jgi:hypothetical protein
LCRLAINDADGLPGKELASLGLSIDEQTAEQKKYQCSWDIGT